MMMADPGLRWDVLGGGKFQTHVELKKRKEAGENLRSAMGSGQSADEFKASEALAQVASEHGIESVTAIAVAYVMSKAENVFPLIGGRKVEHLEDNIQGLSIRLTEEQIKLLESIKPFDIGFPHDFIGADPHIIGHSTRLARTSHLVFPGARQPSSL